MTDSSSPTPMIVIDAGKVGRKKIKRLKKGEGPLIEEVDLAVEALREELGDQAESKELLPVVVLYRKKPRRRRRSFFSL